MSDKIEVVSDGLLEEVTGGEFGKTEHTFAVNDQNYGAFIRSALNVVILFGVSWSGTSERACDLIEQLAVKHPRIKVGIFEVTNSEYLKTKLGIKSVPTTIKYRGGSETHRVEGVGFIPNMF